MSPTEPSKTPKKVPDRPAPQPDDPIEAPEPLDVNGGETEPPSRRRVEPNPEVNTPPDRQPRPGDVPAKTSARGEAASDSMRSGATRNRD